MKATHPLILVAGAIALSEVLRPGALRETIARWRYTIEHGATPPPAPIAPPITPNPEVCRCPTGL